MMRGFLILLCTLSICYLSRAEDLHQDSTYTLDEELTPEQIRELEEKLKDLEVITEIESEDRFLGKDTITIVPYYALDEKPEPIFIPPPHVFCPMEGMTTTVVKALIDIDGSIMKTEILRSSGSEMLDNAALEAVNKAQFKPAKYHGVPVRVWVSIPILFKRSQ
jgi:TonB family protein